MGTGTRLSAERRAFIKALRDDIEKMRKEMEPKYPYLHVVKDAEKPGQLEGDVCAAIRTTSATRCRGTFSACSSNGEPLPFKNGSGRMELADEILEQPIAMRVIVNRIWKAHFGTGLVDSPSNFGFAGERPTHPELLDYLARYFVDNGMSIKKLQREMMLSAVYQLSTEQTQENFAKDAGNRFYWRANRRRMDAEEVRDAMLFVSGALEAKIGGPSQELTPSNKRRTVYGKVSRYRLDEYLQLFDFPSPNLSAEKRFTTTVPLQRLFLMNSDFVEQQAELIARRTEFEPDATARVKKIYQLVLGRNPADSELTTGLEYLRSEPLQSYEERKTAKDKKERIRRQASRSRRGQPNRPSRRARPSRRTA